MSGKKKDDPYDVPENRRTQKEKRTQSRVLSLVNIVVKKLKIIYNNSIPGISLAMHQIQVLIDR